MARYDDCRNELGNLVVDIQSDTLEGLNTRLLFRIAGEPHLLVTQYLAAVRTSTLSATGHSLRDHSDEIAGALDMLLYGF